MEKIHLEPFGKEIAERIKLEVKEKLNIPQLTDHAGKVLKIPHVLAKKGYFEPCNKRLHLKWTTEPLFRGYAATNGNDDFDVVLSYEAAVSIWRDALQMMAVLERAPMIISGLRLDQSQIILTSQRTPDFRSILKNLFELPLTWLFFHEVGHLVEGHGTLEGASHIVRRASDQFEIHDLEASNESSALTGKDAWTSHCLEISADYEGTRFLLRRLFGQYQKITELQVWALVAGVSCLFYRFHGISRGQVLTEAVGTHPDPTARYDFFTTNILSMVTDPAYKAACPWAISQDRVIEIIQHAFIFSSTYWHNFYTQEKFIPELFVKVVTDEQNRLAYIKNFKAEWSQLQPEVAKNSIGNPPPPTMNFGD